MEKRIRETGMEQWITLLKLIYDNCYNGFYLYTKQGNGIQFENGLVGGCNLQSR